MDESDALKSELEIEDLPTALDMVLKAGITPVLIGESGIGKTQTVREYAAQHNLHLVELNCSHIFAEDFGGVREAGDYIVFKLNKIFDVPGPALLFIDEASRSRGELRNLIMGLVNERKMYGQPISDHIRMVLAMNPNTEEYSDTEDFFGDLACVRRFTVFTIKTSPEQWCAWAAKHGVSERTRQFILQNQLALTNGQACPRQWVKIDRILQTNGVPGVRLLGPGTLGTNSKFYLEFLTNQNLITAAQVLADYGAVQAVVVKDRNLQVALASELAAQKFKTIHRNNLIAFLCDLPQELVYSTCMQLLKSKNNKVLFGWIEANPKLKSMMEKDFNY